MLDDVFQNKCPTSKHHTNITFLFYKHLYAHTLLGCYTKKKEKLNKSSACDTIYCPHSPLSCNLTYNSFFPITVFNHRILDLWSTGISISTSQILYYKSSARLKVGGGLVAQHSSPTCLKR